jgi:UDPglucose 6-dehydrogenase
MRIGIVGFGTVGKALHRFLARIHEVVLYDKYLPIYNSPLHKEQINCCALVFIAVPTPTACDGISCDLRAVEEAVSWITPPICIKSTIPPGTTDKVCAAYGSRIAFSPEYVGESLEHPWKEVDSNGFVIVGGAITVFELVRRAYSEATIRPLTYHHTTATLAELCKYMENSFLATKVAFVNQFFELASFFGVDFDQLRSLWLLDPRIGAAHTVVTRERGFGGRCLPKDLRALIASVPLRERPSFLEAVLRFNEDIRTRAGFLEVEVSPVCDSH